MYKTVVVGPLREQDKARLMEYSDRYDFKFQVSADEPIDKDTEVALGVVPKDAVMSLPNLKWLQIFFAGTDVYTMDPDFRKDIQFTNGSGAYGPGIAEHVLTMILGLYKGYHHYLPNMTTGTWRDHGVQYSPCGKRVLIVGAGDIGLCTARILRPFGCHITGIRRVVREVPECFDEMLTLDDLDEALPKADIVICALPGTPVTTGLFGEDKFNLMKDGSVFINVGRGTLVDQDALCKALWSGKLYGAGLDVTNPEPLPADHPLWKAPNLILTPHVSGGTFGHLDLTTEIVMDIVCENLGHFAAGEPLINTVDLASGYRKSCN